MKGDNIRTFDLLQKNETINSPFMVLSSYDMNITLAD